MSARGVASPPRLLILGNAGAGKTTLARALAAERAPAPDAPLPVLCLDAVAFDGTAERRPLAESLALLDAFRAEHPEGWIIEGCYADLMRAASPHATELHLLDPGVETCLAHCRARPWEPDKFPTREAQDAALAHLLEWVATYDTRDDEYGRAAHRAVFDAFEGARHEHRAPR